MMNRAPEFVVARWLNTESSLSVESLRGKVICVFAFQMLCPGCVEYLVPQAKKAFELFASDQVAVIGLHAVFEHHEAMGEASLRAFIHEYGLKFPIGIDAHLDSEALGMPETMRLYQMRGTPTTILIDHNGNLRKSAFGHVDDMLLGAEIMSLVAEQGE